MVGELPADGICSVCGGSSNTKCLGHGNWEIFLATKLCFVSMQKPKFLWL